jgi:hypothetical protein
VTAEAAAPELQPPAPPEAQAALGEAAEAEA